MREIIRKNEKIYDYEIHKLSDEVKLSIILYIIAVLLLLNSIFLSYIFLGDAPTIVAGIGISSIIFNIASIVLIIYEIYVYNNYHNEIRTMLILQLILFSVWIFIIR